MKINRRYLTLLLFFCVACTPRTDPPDPTGSVLLIGSELITGSYVGNGVQWGGYDILEKWTGQATLSEEDWSTLFTRVGFMQPPVVRIMVAPGWNYLIDGVYDPSKSEAVLVRILDFCQAEGISVVFGEWGHTGGDSIDRAWLNQAADFLSWLKHTKGYDCIRYYNMVNEPNGNWSTIDGDYPLWSALVDSFYTRLEARELADEVELIGPDIAVWDNSLTAWISDTRTDLTEEVGVYDIHTYPGQEEVRDGSYTELLNYYRTTVPAGKIMLMTELGFKYPSGSALATENEAREDADPYASDDCNMFVYDAFYGIDMADAIMQNMLAAYSGVIVWDLDDAMYNIDGLASTKLKRWGFWNILGTEKFGNPADEAIRPWFYTVSLLSRYFPAGTAIREVTLPDKKGLRAVVGELNGRFTLAIVNSGYIAYEISLKAEETMVLGNLDLYSYRAGTGPEFTGKTDPDGLPEPDSTGITLEPGPEQGISLDIPSQTFLLYTNMD